MQASTKRSSERLVGPNRGRLRLQNEVSMHRFRREANWSCGRKAGNFHVAKAGSQPFPVAHRLCFPSLETQVLFVNTTNERTKMSLDSLLQTQPQVIGRCSFPSFRFAAPFTNSTVLPFARAQNQVAALVSSKQCLGLEDAKFVEAITKLKAHVLRQRISVQEAFTDFDKLSHGVVTAAQFIRGLAWITSGMSLPISVSPAEMKSIAEKYAAPVSADAPSVQMVNWREFAHDVNQGTWRLSLFPPSPRMICLSRSLLTLHRVITCPELTDRTNERMNE